MRPLSRYLKLLQIVAAGALLDACGGSRVLNKPVEVELTRPLAVAADARVSATLVWVTVKDGPGTWASNAFWDEYHVRVGNHSGDAVSIKQLQAIDALQATHVPAADRDTLLYHSKQTEERFADRQLTVQPGNGTFGMVAAGVAGGTVALAATGYVSGTALVSSAGLSTAGLSSVPAIAAAAYLAPVLIVGSIVHVANNSEVSDEIASRRSEMPIELASGEEVDLRVFFPVTPSPQALLLIYNDGSATRVLNVDTSDVLSGLHFATDEAAAGDTAQSK